MVPTTPLFDPEEYFAREGDASLTAAVTVAAVFWIAMVAYMSIYMWYLFDAATELPDASLGGIVPMTALLMGMIVVLIWLLITTILHGVTRVAGGSGSLKSSLEIAAWGLGAYAIAVLIQPQQRHLPRRRSRLRPKTQRRLRSSSAVTHPLSSLSERLQHCW